MLINNNTTNSSSNRKQWKKLLGCPLLYVPSLSSLCSSKGWGWGSLQIHFVKKWLYWWNSKFRKHSPFSSSEMFVVVLEGGVMRMKFPSSFPYFSLVTKWKRKTKETKYCIYSLWGFCMCVLKKSKTQVVS